MQNSTIKKAIISETPNIKISYDKNDYGFKIQDLEIYKNIFNNIKEEGFLLANNFEDIEWILFDKNESKEKKHLSYDLELQSNLNITLKCFSIQLLNSGYTHRYVQQVLNTIKNTFIESCSFSVDFISEYEDLIFSYSSRKREDIIQFNLMFSEFYSEHMPQEYIILFQNSPLEERNIRTLPNYDSVLVFDYVLTHYMENCSIEERKKYLPILLWWKITTVIPLRPNEFLLLKSDCVFYEKESYWITVPRKKQKGNIYSVEVTNILKVTKEIYDLVQEYLSLQTDEEKGEYLMSYFSYNSFMESEGFKDWSKRRRLRLDKLDKGQMYELIKDFYSLIVEDKYEYKNIERIKIGDTRHFAFCNMMLQGFNMLTIARMGGHLSLKSQVGYSSHLDYFAQARVRVLSEQIKKNREKDIGDTFLSDTNALVVRSKLNTQTSKGMDIQGGSCYDIDFPNNCIDNCIFCSYFKVDLKSKPNIIRDLLYKSNELNKNIQDQINTMQRISQEMFYDIEKMQYSHEEQEKLFNLANKLNRLFNQKALIDCYIENHKEVDGND